MNYRTLGKSWVRLHLPGAVFSYPKSDSRFGLPTAPGRWSATGEIRGKDVFQPRPIRARR